MTDQLNLFEDKPHLHVVGEDIKNCNPHFRVKTGYRKPLEILDEDIDIEFKEGEFNKK